MAARVDSAQVFENDGMKNVPAFLLRESRGGIYITPFEFYSPIELSAKFIIAVEMECTTDVQLRA